MAALGGTTVQGDGWTFRSKLEPIGAVDGGPPSPRSGPEAILLPTSDHRTDRTRSGNPGEHLAPGRHDPVRGAHARAQGLIARLPRPRAPRLEVGGQVWCAWDPEHTHVFGAEQAEIVLVDPAPTGGRGGRVDIVERGRGSSTMARTDEV